jgi:hypothetical protein
MESLGLFFGTLMQSRTQAHIYHLQVEGPGSFAAHEALKGYYENVVDHIDAMIEGLQGKYGIIRGYQMASTIKEDGNPRMYFDGLCQFVTKIRPSLPQDSFFVNQLDELELLINSTKYKLKFLQ